MAGSRPMTVIDTILGITIKVRPRMVVLKRLHIQPCPVHTINLSVFFTVHFYCIGSCFTFYTNIWIWIWIADRCRGAACNCQCWDRCRRSSDRRSVATDYHTDDGDIAYSQGHKLTMMTTMTTDHPLYKHTQYTCHTFIVPLRNVISLKS